MFEEGNFFSFFLNFADVVEEESFLLIGLKND